MMVSKYNSLSNNPIAFVAYIYHTFVLLHVRSGDNGTLLVMCIRVGARKKSVPLNTIHICPPS